jgi:hypothetical protein
MYHQPLPPKAEKEDPPLSVPISKAPTVATLRSFVWKPDVYVPLESTLEVACTETL